MAREDGQGDSPREDSQRRWPKRRQPEKIAREIAKEIAQEKIFREDSQRGGSQEKMAREE